MEPPLPSGFASNTRSSIPVLESCDGFLRNFGRLGTLPCCCLSLWSSAGDRDFLGEEVTSMLMLRANVWLSVSTCSMIEFSFASSLSLRFSWVFTFCKRKLMKITLCSLSLSLSPSLPLPFHSLSSILPRQSLVPCWGYHWQWWDFSTWHGTVWELSRQCFSSDLHCFHGASYARDCNGNKISIVVAITRGQWLPRPAPNSSRSLAATKTAKIYTLKTLSAAKGEYKSIPIEDINIIKRNSLRLWLSRRSWVQWGPPGRLCARAPTAAPSC